MPLKCFKILLIFFLLVNGLGYANTETNINKKTVDADSLKILKQKYENKGTIDNLISLPGYLVYAPIKLVFEGQKFLISQAFEGNSLARVLDVLTTDDGKRGILPTYSSSGGGGLKFFQKGLFTPHSKLSLSATAGLRERKQYQLKLKNIELSKQVNSQFLVKYHFQSDESFYGIGPNSDVDDRTNYARRLVTADLDLGIQLSEKDRIGMLAGFDGNDILSGRNKKYPSTTEVTAFVSLPGMNTEVQMGKLELEVEHNSDFHPGNPKPGFDALLRGGIFQEIDKSDFGFSQLTVDASYYFPLFYKRTIKIRIAGEFTEDVKGRLIPFYYLSEMGRSETIRGFARGRFHDKDMVLSSIEYSYPIWQIINTQLFFDVGAVSHNVFKELNANDLKYGYGVGFQLWNAEGITTEFSIAHSRDGIRFYLGINKSL